MTTTDERTCVLIVEDDPNTRDLVRANLLARGFIVLTAGNARAAVSIVERETPELVLVDLMLPGGVDGFDLCRELSVRTSCGIIVLSARASETDKVRALNLGADDYMTKPFGIDELMARIHATLRRTRPQDESSGTSNIVVGTLTIDLERRRVTRGGEEIHLTPTEFAVLRALAADAGRLVSHATLLRSVWGPGYAAKTEYTRVYIRRLRAKLEVPGAKPLILNEPRVGYRLAIQGY